MDDDLSPASEVMIRGFRRGCHRDSSIDFRDGQDEARQHLGSAITMNFGPGKTPYLVGAFGTVDFPLKSGNISSMTYGPQRAS